jgi:N-acetylglucosamine kinase-like BadF-type ATPase
MILIADSGSTKCDWQFVDREGNVLAFFSTMGFNPYFHSPELIDAELQKSPEAVEIREQVKLLFFYGAGCSSQRLNALIQEGLGRFFLGASIHVEHDLLGAAYAAYDGRPCIVCILGTGSNSCYFDGEKVSEEVPSLAYILGDEASGSYFGKRLLREYFYKKLPRDLHHEFIQEFTLNKDEFVRRVYKEPNTNVYLASFMKFIVSHGNHPHVKQWIREGFREFIDIHVQCFSDYQTVPTHFIGSVAYFFSDILREVTREMNLIPGNIIQKPIDNLVNYHLKYKIPETLDRE